MRSHQDHSGRSRTITDRIAKTEGVKTAYSLTGMFDIIAFEASDTRNLTGTVSTEIQTMGVPRTHTAIVGELVTAGD